MTLPNFLIVGASRAGTTSLYNYLRQHPQIYLSPIKEPRYYWEEGRAEGLVPIQTREAYERLFDEVSGETAVGEASPQYLRSPTAPNRIAADLPGVKLITLLRNPADRAYSSYLGHLRVGTEFRTVEQAMQPGNYYFDSGLYCSQLSRYLATFPRRQLKIILFDDFVSDTWGVIRDVLSFLEVDPDFAVDISRRYNVSAAPRSIAANAVICKMAHIAGALLPMLSGRGLTAHIQRPLLRAPDALPPLVRQRMLDAFREDINRTSTLIERDLSHWLR